MSSYREKAMAVVQEYLDNMGSVLTVFGISKRKFAIAYREPIIDFDEAERQGLIELTDTGVIVIGRKLRVLQ